MKINTAELDRLRAKGLEITSTTHSATIAQPGWWKPRHKFNAQRLELDGRKFSSKAEASYYAYLKLKQQSGELVFCLWQVPLHIPGQPNVIRLVVDFVEFWADGSITFTDCKGMILNDFKIKRRAVQAVYPIKIRVVKMLKSGPRYEDADAN